MISADRKRIAVTAESKHVQVRARERNAAREGQGAAMNEMRAVCLHEIRKSRTATDARHGRDFLVPDFALLDQFEIKGEDGKIAAARAPRRMIGGDIFLHPA